MNCDATPLIINIEINVISVENLPLQGTKLFVIVAINLSWGVDNSATYYSSSITPKSH